MRTLKSFSTTGRAFRAEVNYPVVFRTLIEITETTKQSDVKVIGAKSRY